MNYSRAKFNIVSNRVMWSNCRSAEWRPNVRAKDRERDHGEINSDKGLFLRGLKTLGNARVLRRKLLRQIGQGFRREWLTHARRRRRAPREALGVG